MGALLGVTWALKSWRVQRESLVGSRAQGPAKSLGVLAGRARPGPARQPHQPQAPSAMGRKEVEVSVGQDELLLDTRHKSGGLGLLANPHRVTSGRSRPHPDLWTSPERQNSHITLLWAELFP